MGHIVLLLFVWYNVYWCPTHFQYQMMFMLSSGNMPGVTSGAGTAYPSWSPEFTPIVWWYLCCSIFRFLCGVCRSLFVLFLLAIVLPLYCHCIAFHFVIYGFWLPLVYHQTFSLGHCIAFHFVIYGFWLPLVYHQTFVNMCRTKPILIKSEIPVYKSVWLLG